MDAVIHCQTGGTGLTNYASVFAFLLVIMLAHRIFIYSIRLVTLSICLQVFVAQDATLFFLDYYLLNFSLIIIIIINRNSCNAMSRQYDGSQYGTGFLFAVVCITNRQCSKEFRCKTAVKY